MTSLSTGFDRALATYAREQAAPAVFGLAAPSDPLDTWVRQDACVALVAAALRLAALRRPGARAPLRASLQRSPSGAHAARLTFDCATPAEQAVAPTAPPPPGETFWHRWACYGRFAWHALRVGARHVKAAPGRVSFELPLESVGTDAAPAAAGNQAAVGLIGFDPAEAALLREQLALLGRTALCAHGVLDACRLAASGGMSHLVAPAATLVGLRTGLLPRRTRVIGLPESPVTCNALRDALTDGTGAPGGRPAPDDAAAPEVLLIEDNTMVRLLLKNYLESDGWQVTALATADELGATLPGPACRGVVMDYLTGSTSATDAVASIHAHAPALPVLLISGDDTRLAEAACLADGFSAYLPKPVERGPLIEAVRLLCGAPPDRAPRP